MSQRIGPGAETEGKVLNRIVRYNDGMWEVEADQRHAELIVEQLQLGSGKSISTPGTEAGDKDKEQ